MAKTGWIWGHDDATQQDGAAKKAPNMSSGFPYSESSLVEPGEGKLSTQVTDDKSKVHYLAGTVQ